jgi:hypothetical protein
MKKFLTTTILLAMFATCTTIMAQTRQEEYLGLPGDNLNLYAVMKLFQESQTLEGFERNLNDENSRINNLDLNGDNFIDYINVIDYVDRDVHNIVLRVAINRRENQDVAVFTVQRFSNGQVQIQLIGDEDLYGRNYIIEPIVDEHFAYQTPNPGYTGDVTTYYEIAAWPVIRFIYLPNYVVWHSAWHWDYWPVYWHPWTPFSWHYYYGYHYNWYHNYYSHYHHCNTPRYNHWNDFYYSSRRTHSPYVSERIKSGHYNTTYSHPDQRRQGEALYARTNTDRSNRRADQYSELSTSGRTDKQANQKRQPTATSFSTSRRTNTPVTKSVSNATSVQNTTSSRRADATIGEKPAKRSVETANSFSQRRSANAANARPAATSKPVQSASNSRSTNKPAAKAESFSSRRNSGQSQAVKSSKSSDNKKSAETEKTNRRK